LHIVHAGDTSAVFLWGHVDSCGLIDKGTRSSQAHGQSYNALTHVYAFAYGGWLSVRKCSCTALLA
jgi:hypothetical protein